MTQKGGEKMYKQMYLRLFNAITDAIDALITGHTGAAVSGLIQAQRETERMYLEDTPGEKRKRRGPANAEKTGSPR